MKLTTIITDDGTVAARVDGATCVEITGFTDVGALLAEPDWRALAERADGPVHTSPKHAVLVPNPSKILCVGLNYRSHIEEMGRGLPDHPTIFAKFADTLCGPDDAVAVTDDEVDWEGELALIIGSTVYRADEAEADAAIAGYTVANDISMRAWQYRSTQWLQGKMWARSTPVGPVMVTADAFDASAARLTTEVNGEVMQAHAIADLLFEPKQIVAYLSEIIPLRPGDLILTGTPGGVGRAMTPPRYLRPGDRVTVTIDQLEPLATEMTARHP